MTYIQLPATGTTPPGPFAPGTTLTLTEIADLTGRDLKTIKAWRAKGRWPNAVQDETGRRAWRVPVADMVAAGDLDASQIAHVENELAARRESRGERAGAPASSKAVRAPAVLRRQDEAAGPDEGESADNK